MALLAPNEQAQLREWFNEMTSPVRLLFFTQTIGCDPCEQTKRILDELPALSDRITVEEVNFVLDKDKASQYAIDRVPAIALLGPSTPLGTGSSTSVAAGTNGAADKDSRIRFLGTPAGHEFMSLIQAILLVGGAASQLTEASRERLAAVDQPVTMQVFSTPT
jgi:alkyl hydroperoxide reductase subunit AhpF